LVASNVVIWRNALPIELRVFGTPMKTAVRIAAWMLLAAIVVLSLVPAQDRPVTGAPHDVEHLGIFVVTGLAFGLGYPSRFLLQGIWLVLFAALIEIAQLAVPGRHARFADFVVDAISLLVGIAIAAMAVCSKASVSADRAE
jgi:VanZ family protein